MPDNTPDLYDIIVIGAGISGLTAAYRLARAGKRVALLDKAPQVGGVIQSHQTDGYLLEKGPNSFTSFPEAGIDLVREIGLGGRALCRPMRDHDRFVWFGGALHQVPISPPGFLTTDILPFGQKVRLISGLFRRFPIPDGDVEMGRYFRQRIGDLAVERMLKPFMAGVYAADADRISFEATLPKLFKPAQQHAKLLDAVKGMRTPGKKRIPKDLVSFPDGLIELPNGLAKAFENQGGRLECGVEAKLKKGASQRWAVSMNKGGNGQSIEADCVVSALPAHAAGPFLQEVAPDAAAVLSAVEQAQLVVVHVGLKEEQLGESRDGFGFLSVSDEGIDVLGSIWSSRIFENRAPDGHRLLTCFYGGEKDPCAFEWDDAELERRLRADLKTAMQFRGGDFSLLEITRWKPALPVFRVGHMQRLNKAVDALPDGVSLIGNYFNGISIPDRIGAGIELADHLS